MLSKLRKRSSTFNRQDRNHYYDALVSKFSESYLASGWSHSFTQQSRFQVLSLLGDFINQSVLDIGSGTGDFVDYLETESINCHYLGVDSSSKMISRARNTHPEAIFKCVDFLDPDFSINADYVLASGALSYRVEKPREYLEKAIYKLYSMANKGLAFNLLSQVNDNSSRFMSFNPSDVFALCREWTPYVSMHHHYLLNDFTIFMYPYHE